MNSILDRYIDGKFEYETGSLDVSCPMIELTVCRGSVTDGEFVLTCTGEGKAVGYVLSDCNRITYRNRTFTGTSSCIQYSFDSKGMDEGEVLKTEIHIISNMGEYYIPFVAMVERENLKSTMGNIKNLFHFANLAKTNWQEAVKLFYRKDFIQILNGVDRQYVGIYRGLSGVFGNEQNVDEFLVRINKKKRTEYIPMEDSIRIDAPYGVSEGRATITRNGWGYTYLTVATEGEFLNVEKHVLTDDDFLGNICSFGYYIDTAKLHAGNNYGSILLTNAGVTTTIRFQVMGEQVKGLQLENRRKMRNLTFELLNLYIDFRMKKQNSAQWLKESTRVVDSMMDIDERSVSTRLFKTQLLLTEERYNEAKWQLGMVEKDIVPGRVAPEIWCYYLYLTTLCNREEGYVNEIAEEVENIYIQNQGNWKIAWLMLYLTEEYSRSAYRRWAFLEKLFVENCTSPVIYVEAVLLIRMNPSLMNKLSQFEIQILNFAARHDMLTEEVISQVQYLMTKVKEYHPRLLYILSQCYERKPDDITLENIVTVLMRGNRTDEEAFVWYCRAVERELKIIRLYEYYMMSLPKDYTGELPKMVMMYFAYHSELDYTRKAVLYANIVRYREDFPEIAESYRETIDLFMVDQIRKGHINKELAYLYKNAMSPYTLQPEFAKDLIPLLFTNLITVEDERIKSVVLIYHKLKKEQLYPLDRERCAYVPIYTSEYEILLQDAYGNRYAADMEYRIEKLLIPGKFLKDIPEDVPVPLAFDCYLCENSRGFIAITDKNWNAYRRLFAAEELDDEYRNEIGLKLMEFFFETDKIEEGENLLENIVPDRLTCAQRAVYIQYFVNRGMLDKAFEWVCEYGTEQIDNSIMVKLCSRVLARTEFEQNQSLLNIVYRTFHNGKYDENMVKYLVEYYEGMTRDMRDIWMRAREFGVDTQAICEKMLLQILFTGSYVGQRDEIFEEYISGNGRLIVIKAYLTYSAYDYFVRQKMMEDSIFRHLTRLFYRGESFHDVCKYAYLKYYSENPEAVTEEVQILLGKFLPECLDANVMFPFFQNLRGVVPQAAWLMDKTMIEYRANPKSRVCIHYVLQSDVDEGGEYETEEMTNMYEGIFVKTFTLFFGEKLQYYITEEAGGDEELTESDTIQKSELTEETGESRFHLINEMMVARTLQEYSTVDCLLEEYYRREAMVNDLFTLI